MRKYKSLSRCAAKFVSLWFANNDERGPDAGMSLVVVLCIAQHVKLRLPHRFSMRQPPILTASLK
jgi:hypothetical protein